VLFSAALTWLLARSVRTGENWLLLPAGPRARARLLNKPLIGVLGRRAAGRDRAGRGRAGCCARAGCGPGRRWSSSAARPTWCGRPSTAGRSCTWPARSPGGDAQGGRIGFIPFQLLLVSPVLAPVWIAGLVRVFRAGPGRPFRFLGIGYLLLAVVYLLAGGKAVLPRRDVPRCSRPARSPPTAGCATCAGGPGCWPARWRCRWWSARSSGWPCCRPGRSARCSRSTRTPASRSPGRGTSTRSPRSGTGCPARSGDRGACSPRTTARPAPSTGTGRPSGCRRRTAGTTGSPTGRSRSGRPPGRGRRLCGRLGARAGCSAPASSRRPWTTGSAWTPRSRACRSGSAASRPALGRDLGGRPPPQLEGRAASQRRAGTGPARTG
jgi:hypothetical protein